MGEQNVSFIPNKVGITQWGLYLWASGLLGINLQTRQMDPPGTRVSRSWWGSSMRPINEARVGYSEAFPCRGATLAKALSRRPSRRSPQWLQHWSEERAARGHRWGWICGQCQISQVPTDLTLDPAQGLPFVQQNVVKPTVPHGWRVHCVKMWLKSRNCHHSTTQSFRDIDWVLPMGPALLQVLGVQPHPPGAHLNHAWGEETRLWLTFSFLH